MTAPDIPLATLESSKERAIAALDVFEESVDPCRHGHVEHGPEAHVGRRLVHSMTLNGMGADWDYEGVVAFIQGADVVARGAGVLKATGHGVVVHSEAEKRWVAFATKEVPG